ncbi:AP-3 complex subunit sigma-1, partial [Antrostomus carolinensis]|uniref:AP-3 complex subunit sigma-1 n=1 Tax=Antrostomus carolinensis TaxID=279965 RepID=UPI0010A9947F
LTQFKEHKLWNEDTQQQIIRETFHLVSKRDENVCNFLEGGLLIGGSDNKLIYRHYATLYFVFCVDSSESELGILDLIQVFVETLDKCFENVCELDLIFHVDKDIGIGIILKMLITEYAEFIPSVAFCAYCCFLCSHLSPSVNIF